MKTYVRHLWPVLFLALALLWAPLPALAGGSLPAEGGWVVELGEEEYGVPVYIQDPLIPAGSEWVSTSQRTFGSIFPVFLSVVMAGFSDVEG